MGQERQLHKLIKKYDLGKLHTKFLNVIHICAQNVMCHDFNPQNWIKEEQKNSWKMTFCPLF